MSLGDAAAWPVAAAIRHFRDDSNGYFKSEECLKRKLWIAIMLILWKQQ